MINQWLSPAKINLFLYITGKRSDGYHYLQTLYQLINYGDIITLYSTNNNKINLFTSVPYLNNQNNLIMRAAKLLQFYCWPKGDAPGVSIVLKKNLPIGSGLGGGSSNAATVLVGLNKYWNCGLDLETLMHLGVKLGADVPFFIYGRTAFAEGIGELLTPVFLNEKWYLILVPNVYISTSIFFRTYELKIKSRYCSMKELLVSQFSNDCEPYVRKLSPVVEKYFSWLLYHTSIQAKLTGTGSCLFGEFDYEDHAQYVQNSLPSWMKSFIAKGINISPLYYMHTKCN